jgi:hypothetical protein
MVAPMFIRRASAPIMIKSGDLRISSKDKFDAISLFVAALAMATDDLDNPVKYRGSFAFQRLSKAFLD